jgi:hypothetical protein
MRGVAESAELVDGLVQRSEIVEELRFGQLFLWGSPFVLSWVSMKYFMVVLLG